MPELINSTESVTHKTNDRQLRGERLHGRRRRWRRGLGLWWKNHAEVDWLLAGIAVGNGLALAAAFDLWSIIGADQRVVLGRQALITLGALTGFLLTALGIAKAIRGFRSSRLSQPGVSATVDRTWIRAISGSFGGLLVLGISWSADVAFGWAWTGWLALGATLFTLSRIARGLWLFLMLVDLAE